MAAVLKPGSSKIKVTGHPKVALPTVTGGNARFNCAKDITAEGTVILTGSQPAVGWTLGFIQVEWVDTNWLYYRGQANNDGSCFFQRSRPPARPVKACRDFDIGLDPANNIFYPLSTHTPPVTGADTFPLTLKASLFDSPQDGCAAVVTNSKTGKQNFLREAQLEFLFCAVLSARDPAGKFHHLKSIYWNVRWQARFLPVSFANPNGAWHVKAVANGNGQAVSHVIDGKPSDPRFKDILTDTTVPGCNAIVPLYSNLPVGHVCRRESRVWDNFNVTR